MGLGVVGQVSQAVAVDFVGDVAFAVYVFEAVRVDSAAGTGGKVSSWFRILKGWCYLRGQTKGMGRGLYGPSMFFDVAAPTQWCLFWKV